MANKIQIKRGVKANLPTLSVGEPALCTDTSQVFVGGNNGNIELAKASDLSDVAHKTGILQTNLNADKIDGYDAGNLSGNIPVSNGTVNTNLNADMVDGFHVADLGQYVMSGSKDLYDMNSKNFFVMSTSNDGNLPTAEWWHIINLPHQNADGHTAQIIAPYYLNAKQNLYWRNANGTTGWGPWHGLQNTDAVGQITITGQNGYATVGGSMACYSKTQDSIVTLDVYLTVTSGVVNTIMFTLPVGYRPTAAIRFPATVYNGDTHSYIGDVIIMSDGTAKLDSLDARISSFNSLSFVGSFVATN
ncbi:hypothetical protein [Clostridium sp.]|uniref:hyaluronate lyase N-terminal domain-containing protein n=1 Tax=Clostridium sp. TaxID=1506 RepID=UPI00262A5C54|nr:hypothetical protein [Clostridium sp.]